MNFSVSYMRGGETQMALVLGNTAKSSNDVALISKFQFWSLFD